MRKTVLALAALAAALAAPMSAQAHRGWIQPSSTVLSGAEGWVSFDLAMSNGVFIPDHAAMRVENLTILAPDGSPAEAQNLSRGRLRQTFDVHLDKPGTWKVANVLDFYNAVYKQGGEQKRWRGTASEMAAAIPADATEVTRSRTLMRVETFVTLGQPTDTVFAPTGQGLELVPVTHPNDLVAGEAATFTLMLDGRPAANQTITIARSGLRYRDNPEEATVTTGADGRFSVTWPQAGLYWLNAAVRDTAGPDGVAVNAQYNGVVEVLP